MLQALVEVIGTHVAQLPDYRKASPNRKYSVRDAALSAFAMFMMQAPSFLAQQRDMQRTKGRNNAQSLFGVHQIPSDNQIRDILDPIAPSYLSTLFWQVYGQLQASQLLTAHTGIAGTHLCALDGMYYFVSHKLHCPNCTRQQHEGYVSYSHAVIAPVLVGPDAPQVFSLEPEFIQAQDGSEKQDCELNASKRWLRRNGSRLPTGRTTFLADDLYCKQPFCELVQELHDYFILVCLPESHPTLYTEVELLAVAGLLDSLSERVWNGRFYERHSYRFTNRIPLRNGADALKVNWCELSIVHEKTGELLYHNTFATNFVLSAANVAVVVRSGRARWKTENENHNTLKHRGYHLEHNFGHGQQYLSALFVAFNLLAFLLQVLSEHKWDNSPEERGSDLRVTTGDDTVQGFFRVNLSSTAMCPCASYYPAARSFGSWPVRRSPSVCSPAIHRLRHAKRLPPHKYPNRPKHRNPLPRVSAHTVSASMPSPQPICSPC